MAWNEPGGGNGKDPWGGGGGKGPPDLDEVVRKMQEKVSSLFGGGGGAGGDGGMKSPGPAGFAAISAVVVIVLTLWLLTGFYVVDQGTRALVLTFGEHSDTTSAGLHWRFPAPVQHYFIVDTERTRYVEVGYRRQQSTGSVPQEALMLTRDENIIDIRLAIQYKVRDPDNFLFNIPDRDPDPLLRQIAESAIREVVGKSPMDFALKEGRSDIESRTEELIQSILDRYKSGLLVISVNLQDAQPPEEVQAAFTDAIKAREDEQRQKKEAEAYANEIIPKARGAAARQIAEANGYKQQIVANARGEAQRFSKLVKEYEKAPVVTRERLYLDAMEHVLENVSKVVIDAKSSGNLLYLPMDKLMAGQNVNPGKAVNEHFVAPTTPTSSGSADLRLRDNRRGRRSR